MWLLLKPYFNSIWAQKWGANTNIKKGSENFENKYE